MRNREKDKRKEKGTDGAEAFAPPQPASSSAPRMLSPLDIQQKEFRYARFGGYKMRDVDEFLDRVTEAMSAVVSENERLRAGGSSAPPVLGTPDLDDVGRQADEIIQRARDEAERILDAARAKALTTGALTTGAVAAGAVIGGTEEDRAAVNAFLAKEKEFLQSLAGLVQGHAGSVKEMAKSARARPTPAASSTPAAAAPASEGRPTTPAPSARATTPKPTPSTPPAPPTSSAPPTRPETTISLPRAEEPVRMDEPAAATARRDGGDDDGREAGDSSLRELFWGEE